jgi:2-keto-4-pentenoate hydratase/2-oxohepta-3-ene-1,7-dioic acid hydratase in catechol pathway
MRLCRFDEGRLGVVEGDHVRDVTGALDVLPGYRYPLPEHDVLIANLDEVLARARTIVPQAPSMPWRAHRLLSPIANAGKIIAAPVNYHKHLDEVRGDPALHQSTVRNMLTIHDAGVFLKATSSVVGPGEGIVVRRADRRTDHEVELAFVIGRQASRVSAVDAMKYVAGYAIGLDITIRGSEDRSLRKSADSYTVLGPWLVTADEIPDPGALDLWLELNGEVRQQSNTRHLILGVPQLIELASSFYTLYPGDVILTGTPEGVSPIEPGDRVMAGIERIGTMAVAVRAPDEAGAAAMSGAATGQA